jgi:hypothetical protein
MNKILLLSFLLLISRSILFSQEQSKNLIGVSAGIVPGQTNMYFGDPWDFWPNREQSPIYQLFYARQLSDFFRVGTYLEFETVKFSTSPDYTVHSFSRSNFGFNWLGQYPKTALHMQLGAYAGYGFLTADKWDNLNGFDIGLMVGPAYEKGHFGVATHLHSGHAWYSSSGTPSGVMLYNPKILLKVYYKF